MADIAQLEAALVKADAAGDVEGAKVLAGEVRRMRSFADVKAEGVTRSEPPLMTPSGEKNLPQSMADYKDHPELLAADPAVRLSLGAASPFIGLFQLGANAIGKGEGVNAHLKQLEDMKQKGRAELGSEGFDFTEAAGTVGSPAFRMLPKGGKTLAGQTAAGAGAGAAAGVTAPVTDGGKTYWDTKGEQLATGTALGAILPPVAAVLSKAGKMAYHSLIEPTFEAGRTAIKGRAYSEAAGDKSSEIIDLLTRNKQLVEGSHPTAGEAASPAGRAEFSALQESAAKVKPSDYLSRTDQQNAARQAAIGEFAGNPAKLAEAEAARASASGLKYGVGSAQLTNDLSGLDILRKRPSVEAAISRAEKGAAEQGRPFSLLGDSSILSPSQQRGLTGQDAQRIKLAFDDEIKLFPKSGVDSAELRDMKASRAAYIEWMEKQFPDLAAGRAAFRENSAPINQMQVGRALEDKLTPALRDDAKQRAGAFSSAARDSATTIKKATGEPRFTELEDVLTGRQLQTVNNVQGDLARSDRHLEMARKGASAGPNAVDLATANLEREVGGKIPNVLHRGAMIANAIITRLEGKVNRKMAAEMATEMLNPPKVGEALGAAKAREMRNAAMAEAILKAQRLSITGGAALTAHQGD